MSDQDLTATVKNIDRRLQRVEQILPTLATREEIKTLATKEELREALAKLATKEALREAVAGLATKEELREAVDRLEAKIEEQARGFRDVVYEAVRQAWTEAQPWAKVELEAMRDAIKVLAESTAGWSPAVERVDRESRARDDALDQRILAFEAREPAPPAASRRPRRK